MALLLATDEIRAARPTVHEEVEQGLYFLQGAIWETVPRIHRELQAALERHYGVRPEIPAFLRYRSWIGGDRDGNPNVTPEVTAWTVRAHRRAALRLHLRELRALRRELSVSARQVPVPAELWRAIAEEAAEHPLAPEVERRYRHEPYRLRLTQWIARLQRLLAAPPAPRAEGGGGGGDVAARYLADLQQLARCLQASGLAEVARAGRLADLIVRAQTFGLHLATLDVREHSAVHEGTVAALFARAGVHPEYARLPEPERVRLLAAELDNPRPLLSPHAELPPLARRTMECMAVVREAVAADPRAVGAWIVSMTHAASDGAGADAAGEGGGADPAGARAGAGSDRLRAPAGDDR
ncbi:MAG: hypothetical protein KatS3mg102_0681 [Planctomycetota bacterium]|nr:MAG: hypothetical protein KatS3mg102_0681 [Planctomycetota bacterium]